MSDKEVSHLLGKYLNTMVADLRIEGKGQYLRDLFSRYEAELAVECRAPAPQPAESIDCYAVFNSGFMQQSFADEATAEEYAEAKFSDSPEVEIKKMRLVEVRRASPQPADEAKRLIHKAVMALSGEVSGRKIADALLALADLRELVELAASPQVTPTPKILASLKEFLALRQACIDVGGTEGPLDQEMITRLAEMQIGVVDRAQAAIAEFEGTSERKDKP